MSNLFYLFSNDFSIKLEYYYIFTLNLNNLLILFLPFLYLFFHILKYNKNKREKWNKIY